MSAQQATCLPSRPPVCLAVVIYSRLTEAVSPTVNSLRHILMLANKDIQEMHFRVVCCVNNVSTLYIVIHRYCCHYHHHRSDL